MTFHPGLQPLTAYDQFLLYKLVPGKSGKKDKIPINPHTLAAVNPHSPAAWVNAAVAENVAALCGPDYGVAFAITRNDPFFFLDIDNCGDGRGNWTELAQQLVGTLQGAAVEISQSGTGLHIFGTGNCPDHGCKNALLGLELYTEDRFVALTNHGVMGDANTNCSPWLPGIVQTYFPPPVRYDAEEWRDEAVPEWSGPSDDDELLDRMMRSGSAKKAFGGGVSFADLFEGNEDTLGKKYPAINLEDPYDRSSADAALAQMLAFWTGKNHARIECLMRRSALVRDKWDRHKSYISMTVSTAVSRQLDVYKGKGNREAEERVSVKPQKTLRVEASYTTGDQFMVADHMMEHFEGCVYIQDQHRVLTKGGVILKPEQFRATYGGYEFSINSRNDKTTRNAWEAFVEGQVVRFPKVNGTCFRPELPPSTVVMEEDRSLVNTYVPITVEKKQGDATLFIRHVEMLFPDPRDREIIYCYMAALVQYPGVKFQWAPVIQGAEGNGKSFLSRALSHAVGNRYTHLPTATELGDGGFKFNNWITNKLLIVIEEIYVSDKRELTEPLKVLVTNARIEIQAKGVDQYTGDNRANFIMFSNHKDAININLDNRRYAMFYTPQQSAADILKVMGETYFVDLYNWANGDGYAIIAQWLSDYRIADAYNPATRLQRAPQTTSTDEAIFNSMGSVEHAILEAIEEDRPGFRGGWISSKVLEDLLSEMGASRKIPINKRRDMLIKLGYDWHPRLNNGRTNSLVPSEGVKPKLFIKSGSLLQNLQYPAEIQSRYEADQGYPGGFGNDHNRASRG
jgi:hypothetical protein